MLDIWYPNWCELVKALREIRAYLRAGNHSMNDTPEQYNLTNIRHKFEERAYIKNDSFSVALFATAHYCD